MLSYACALMRRCRSLMVAATVLVGASAAQAQTYDWDIKLTVDNQYRLYFGDAFSTNTFVGSDNDWTDVESWNVLARPASDYLYVVTSSDHGGLQGFLGSFTSTPTGGGSPVVVNTGSSVWEVFPAGQYASQLGFSVPWPQMVYPTIPQIDNAISFAQTNSLWVAPDTAPGWDNDHTTNNPSYPTSAWAGPWSYYPLAFQAAGIPASAEWIWHDSTQIDPPLGSIPDPFDGENHNEFLIFRIKGTGTQNEPADPTINVTKYHDLNGDGVQQPGEPVLPDWRFNVEGQGTGPVGTIITGPGGTGTLNGLPFGDYTVTEIVNQGWQLTTPGTQNVSLDQDQSIVDISFGNQPIPPSITIVKFYDENRDGVRQPGEPLMSDFDFNIDYLTNNLQVSTGPGGTYTLDLTAFASNNPSAFPLTMTITELLGISPFTNTTPLSQILTVNLGDNIVVEFGNALVPEPAAASLLALASLLMLRRRQA